MINMLQHGFSKSNDRMLPDGPTLCKIHFLAICSLHFQIEFTNLSLCDVRKGTTATYGCWLLPMIPT